MADIERQTIRFPADVLAELRKIAERDDRSVNWTVVAAVKQYIENRRLDDSGASVVK